MKERVFSNWTVSSRCGASPDFPFAGIIAKASCTIPRSEWRVWSQSTIGMVKKLPISAVFTSSWLQSIELETSKQTDFNPFAFWLRALFETLQLPAYPLKVRQDADNTLHVYSAYPYENVTKLALQLVDVVLTWGYVVMQSGKIKLPLETIRQWTNLYEQSMAMLPTAQVMNFHQSLCRNGITWRWPGGDQTWIGQGINQKLTTPLPEDALAKKENWSIPIYTVTGSVGKTTTARLLFQILRHTGKRVALTASDGAWVRDEKILDGDCIGGLSARHVLSRPDVEVAVFEQGRGGLIKQGVPYAESAVSILLNVAEVHLGLDGIRTVHEMADVKACGIRQARIVVLNMDDEQCRRIGQDHPPKRCVWFSTRGSADTLQTKSLSSHGALGIDRTLTGEPHKMTVWQDGLVACRFDLNGVTPYHGLLGEKTLEELLAAVGAAWFGPLRVPDWESRLRSLRLDSDNHLFRTSIHKKENTVYVLDKAGEPSSLKLLAPVLSEIVRQYAIEYRILVLCRSAAEPPELHRASCAEVFAQIDEFICFDRSETYKTNFALPEYSPGSIPMLLRDEFQRLNEANQTFKPVSTASDWSAAAAILQSRLMNISGNVMVLINQPTTSAPMLNRQITDFVDRDVYSNHSGEPINLID